MHAKFYDIYIKMIVISSYLIFIQSQVCKTSNDGVSGHSYHAITKQYR